MNYLILIGVGLLLNQVSGKCQKDLDCNNGWCQKYQNVSNVCRCYDCYSLQNGECSYVHRQKDMARFYAILTGWLGGDWYYMSLGNPFYIMVGLCKLLNSVLLIHFADVLRRYDLTYPQKQTYKMLTMFYLLLTIGLWWYDIIRITAGLCNFRDSNGYCLCDGFVPSTL